MPDLPVLLMGADVVILSLPDNSDTHNIINESALTQMKPGSFSNGEYFPIRRMPDVKEA